MIEARPQERGSYHIYRQHSKNQAGNNLGGDLGKIVTLGTEILPYMGPREK